MLRILRGTLLDASFLNTNTEKSYISSNSTISIGNEDSKKKNNLNTIKYDITYSKSRYVCITGFSKGSFSGNSRGKFRGSGTIRISSGIIRGKFIGKLNGKDFNGKIVSIITILTRFDGQFDVILDGDLILDGEGYFNTYMISKMENPIKELKIDYDGGEYAELFGVITDTKTLMTIVDIRNIFLHETLL